MGRATNSATQSCGKRAGNTLQTPKPVVVVKMMVMEVMVIKITMIMTLVMVIKMMMVVMLMVMMEPIVDLGHCTERQSAERCS